MESQMGDGQLLSSFFPDPLLSTPFCGVRGACYTPVLGLLEDVIRKVLQMQQGRAPRGQTWRMNTPYE